MGLDSAVVSIQTGYYEQNDPDARLLLEKLEAAGIVDYEVERYAWWETKREKKTVTQTVTKYYYWYSYPETVRTTKWVTSYDYNEHFLVNVNLTEAAQKYVLNAIPAPKTKEVEDRDFRQPIYYDSLYPENRITSLSEDWPEVPHPLAEGVYKKCMGILAEVKAMLDENNGYSKAEQKLNTLERVDNFNCMTTVQKNEVYSEARDLEQRINRMKGDEAFAKAKSIIEEATSLLNNAKACKDIPKAVNKCASVDRVSNYDKMSATQSSEISNMVQNFSELVGQKNEEFGCEKPKVETQEQVEEESVEENTNLDPQAIAYEKAKNNLQPNNFEILFAFRKKAIVARDVRIGQSAEGTNATAEVIYKIDKVTDAGRVLTGVINDKRIKDKVGFTYFNDKGWVINKDNATETFFDEEY